MYKCITKDNIIFVIQFILIIFTLFQLLNGAIIAALFNVLLVYLVGALEYM